MRPITTSPNASPKFFAPPMKLCSECKHAVCAKNKPLMCGYGQPVSPVFGNVVTNHQCDEERSETGSCGSEGRNYLANQLVSPPTPTDDIGQVEQPGLKHVVEGIGAAVGHSSAHESSHQIGVVLGIAFAEFFINVAPRLGEIGRRRVKQVAP